MLTYSAAAYHDIQPHYPCDIMHTIDDRDSGVQCYIRISGRRAIITFRGTNSALDRYKNIMFCQKCNEFDINDPKVCVHRGFMSAYLSENVRERIHSLIKSGIDRVSITGHSLGAAMATLCAYDLYASFPEKVYEVYLFGSPRVGNARFARSYNKKLVFTLRIENGNDIVCKVPPALFGYRHVGATLHIGKAKNPLAVSFVAHDQHKYLENLTSTMFLHRC